jgi:uncharacterized C2H2 Zn-finger protein
MHQQTEYNTLIPAEDASSVGQVLDFDFSQDDLILDPADLLLTEAMDSMFCSPESLALGSVDFQSSSLSSMLATFDTSQSSDTPYDLSDYSSGVSINTSPLDLDFSPDMIGFSRPLQDFFPSPDSCGQNINQSMLEMPQQTISMPAAIMGGLSQEIMTSNQQMNRLVSSPNSSTQTRSRWICPSCDKDLKTKRDLQRHIDGVHENKRFPCLHCPMTFSRLDNVQRHTQKKHGAHRISRQGTKSTSTRLLVQLEVYSNKYEK